MSAKLSFTVHIQDYQALFNILEGFVKPAIEREINRRNINNHAANLQWLAWQNTKRMMTAIASSGVDYEELITWLEACAKQRKEETIISSGDGAQNLSNANNT